MSSRLLIPVLCVAAVVFACGPRARDELIVNQAGAALVSATSSGPASVSASRDAKKSTSPVNGTLYVRASESNVRLALHVENTGSKSLELTFASGQTHDFVVLDTIGRELWRWSRDRMFTQTLRNRLLGGGESMEIEETWRGASLAPGTYVARAFLTSQNYPLVEEIRFVVTASTRVAAR